LAYGASDGNGGGFLYTPTSSASTFPCSLNSWGYDPAPGRDKACFFKPQTPAASGAVTNASITPQPGSALVSWQPPSYQGSTYTSYYTVGLAQSGVAISTASLPATSTSYTVPGLVYGANYQITINACNDIGCSPWTGNVVPNQFSIAHCAYEGQTCSVGQPVTINYYYYNSYYNCIYNFNASACNWYGYADGILRQNYAANQTINCSNERAGFSGDPSYGNGKSCDWTPANQFPAGPMGYTTPNVYNYCIDEGGSCDLPNNTPNGVTVWFGRTIQGQSMSANWYSRSYPSSATSTTCVASNFNAPASSVTRSCFYVIN
jgi:hypothetical protein